MLNLVNGLIMVPTGPTGGQLSKGWHVNYNNII